MFSFFKPNKNQPELNIHNIFDLEIQKSVSKKVLRELLKNFFVFVDIVNNKIEDLPQHKIDIEQQKNIPLERRSQLYHGFKYDIDGQKKFIDFLVDDIYQYLKIRSPRFKSVIFLQNRIKTNHRLIHEYSDLFVYYEEKLNLKPVKDGEYIVEFNRQMRYIKNFINIYNGVDVNENSMKKFIDNFSKEKMLKRKKDLEKYYFLMGKEMECEFEEVIGIENTQFKLSR